MFIKSLLLCAFAGLPNGATKAGESAGISISHPLEFLPEDSKVREKCLNLPRSWIFKSEAEKGCNHITELFKKQMCPKTADETSQDKLCAHNHILFGILRRMAYCEALKEAIRNIIPEEAEKTKYREYGQVVDTYNNISEILKNNARIQRQREKQEK